MDDPHRGIGRREFMQRSAAATLGLGALGLPAAALGAEEPRVRRYSKLGNTDLEISDISIGTGSGSSAAVVRHAFDRGITYFDTAEGYPMGKPGRAELAIGTALQGLRDQVTIASKTLAAADVRRGVLMQRLEASLRRLRTDRIDVYFNHAVNSLDRLRNPEWFEFAQRAKKQGKIRYTGMSGHGGHLIECLEVAIEEKLVDVILCAYNFGEDPAFYERFTRSFDLVANQTGLPRVLAKARKQGIGVIAMKTLMGSKLNDMRPHEWTGSTYSQAAFRWVLSNPDIDGLIVTMKEKAQIDEFLGASGKGAVRARDLHLLERYARSQSESYCRFGCDACESACPHGVAVSDVLRARMYAEGYGDLELARGTYAKLDVGASPCLSCADPRCVSSCPFGLPVDSLTRSTAGLLAD